jgi:hypothetical protein
MALAASAAAAGDVAIVNDVAGAVHYASGKQSASATAFMKVAEGDAFTVPAGARLRLLYLANGRQETYRGPARFVAGADASRVQQGAAPQVQMLPPIVPLKVAKTVELAATAKTSRMGGITLRGLPPRLTPEQQAEVNAARETYKQLRASAAENDITPELFLYSVLYEHQLTGEARALLNTMQKRQPDNPEVARIAAELEQ